MSLGKDQQALKKWFTSNRRNFPWRENPTPYQVWISEVMLQQTRASVVISYYQRWMKRFPTIQALVKGTKDEVIKLWEGLGYYSRARNIFEGAEFIMDHFSGNIPKDPKLLKHIKGLGPYTIGAIRSFAFQEKAAAIDGNVTRVICRYFAIDEDVSKTATKQKIEEMTYLFLEDKNPHIVMESLIELGALVCNRIANCPMCPLNNNCLSYKNHLTDKIPIKVKRQRAITVKRFTAVIQCNSRYLIFKEKNNLMKDLYQFPYFDFTAKISTEKIKTWIHCRFNFTIKRMIPLKLALQFYTKYKVQLHPYLIDIQSKNLPINYQWATSFELKSLPLCSGHRKILKQL